MNFTQKARTELTTKPGRINRPRPEKLNPSLCIHHNSTQKHISKAKADIMGMVKGSFKAIMLINAIKATEAIEAIRASRP